MKFQTKNFPHNQFEFLANYIDDRNDTVHTYLCLKILIGKI